MLETKPLTRETADKHLLYQWSVQEPEKEIRLMTKVFKQRRKREPLVLREDFCGTAVLACLWAKSAPKRRAIGLDIDAETLSWGERHNRRPLNGSAKRVDLRRADVRTVTAPKADLACALNFSYFVFHRIADLEDYFRAVKKSLRRGGLFFLDLYGGWEAQQPAKDKRKVTCPQGRRFTYIWQQSAFDPINNRTTCHIHFKLPNGDQLKRAFTYDWRQYSPVEVQEALQRSGFRNIEVLWDVEDDEERTKYRPRPHAENMPGWLAYVVGEA